MQPSLDTLHQFSVLARRLSFRAAAAELGMAPSTLSERIRELEARMGARLFDRSTRSVALTEEGRRLHARVADAAAILADAARPIRGGDTLTGRIRINGPRPALELRLLPLVASFQADHPGVGFEIVAQSDLIDIVAGGFDAGVRYDDRLDGDMIAVRLGTPQRMVVVGSPAYLDARGRPRTPEDLAAHDCIAHVFAGGTALPWSLEKGGRAIDVVPRGGLRVNGIELAAARAGLGLAYLFDEYAAADVDAGLLETVLDDWTPPFGAPSLYYTERRLMPPALRAFVDHVKARRNG